MSDLTDTPTPVWQAVTEGGAVVGVWRERGTMTPEKIREYRDEYHPDTRLRVTTFTVTQTWDDE